MENLDIFASSLDLEVWLILQPKTSVKLYIKAKMKHAKNLRFGGNPNAFFFFLKQIIQNLKTALDLYRFKLLKYLISFDIFCNIAQICSFLHQNLATNTKGANDLKAVLAS